MKKYTIILLLFLWWVSGCDFKDKNIDPNNLTGDKLDISQRLPSVEYYLASMLGGRLPFSIGNTMGQVIYQQGNTQLNSYIYSASDPSKVGLWNDLYSNIMFNAKTLDNESGNNSVYKALAKIIYCFALSYATDVWGDVPNEQIFQKAEYPNPKFDSQETIYTFIQNELDIAIGLLNNPQGISPTSNDYIYNGDVNKWKRLAYSLKARLYIHLVNVDVEAYSKADASLKNALTGNQDNAVIFFQSTGTNQQVHPLYYERTGGTNTLVDTRFSDLLTARRDPRLRFYTSVKIDLSTGGKRALYGPFVSSPDSYSALFTYEECLFIKAEILLHTEGRTAAEPVFKDAILSSLQRVCAKTVGSSDSTSNNLVSGIPDTSTVIKNYLSRYGNIDTMSLSDEDAWNTLFEQKYIALFLQPEVWNDYRRSSRYVPNVDGLPKIIPRAGTVIPKRYMYPFNETNYNTSAPPDPGIFTSVWWDSK